MNTYQPKGEDHYQCREVKAERDRLRARIAELEAERNELRKACERIAGDPYKYGQRFQKAKTIASQALARSTDTKCCNQPDQCWEPCGDLSKSEAHAKPVDTEDE